MSLIVVPNSLSDIYTQMQSCLHPLPHPLSPLEETLDNAATLSSETPAREYFSRESSIINHSWDFPRPVFRCVHSLLWDNSGHLPHAVLV